MSSYVKICTDNREKDILREFDRHVEHWRFDSIFDKHLVIDFDLDDPDCTANLELGDFVNIGDPGIKQKDTRHILIERKNWPDLKDTQRSKGSRQTQFLRYVESLGQGKRVVVLMTGQMGDLFGWEMKQARFYGSEFKMEEEHISLLKGLRKYLMNYMRFGIPVFQAPDLFWMTHDLINILWKGFSLKLKEIPTIERVGRKKHIIEIYMAGINDFGPAMASKLAEIYPTCHEVFKATDEELLEIRGFGEGRVAEIRKFINQEWS